MRQGDDRPRPINNSSTGGYIFQEFYWGTRIFVKRSTPVAKEAAKGPAKKKAKSAPKKKSATAKKPKGTAASRPPERGKNAIYVLIIMVLLTALALLFGKFYGPRISGGDEKPKEQAAAEKKAEKQEKSREVENTKEERPEKAAHEEKTQKQPEKNETPAKQPAENVRIYFVALNEKTDKMYLAPVQRKVNKEQLLENTLRELVRGPTSAEKRKGLLTAIPPELKINSVRIRNRTAEIDFNGAIEHGAAGNILINRIDQIVYTATQFNSVNSVIIKINGKTRQTLGADGLSISGPLHRRQ
jgi:spore germination protein GerM